MTEFDHAATLDVMLDEVETMDPTDPAFGPRVMALVAEVRRHLGDEHPAVGAIVGIDHTLPAGVADITPEPERGA